MHDVCAVVQHVQDYVLFDYLPACDVPDDGTFDWGTHQVLHNRRELQLCRLIRSQEQLVVEDVHDGLILHDPSQRHDFLVPPRAHHHLNKRSDIPIAQAQEEVRLEQAAQLLGSQLQRLVERYVFGDVLEGFLQLHQAMRVADPLSPGLFRQVAQKDAALVG